MVHGIGLTCLIIILTVAKWKTEIYHKHLCCHSMMLSISCSQSNCLPNLVVQITIYIWYLWIQDLIVNYDIVEQSLWWSGLINPFTAKFSNVLHNASKKPFYQFTHTIYLQETIYKIVPYRLGKPKTFLD